MKKLLQLLTVILLTTNMFAVTPQKMSYQAVIRNTSNNLITNSPIGTKISILQGSISGTVVYSERQTVTTNANGLMSIEIGNGSVISGSFSSIDWSTGTFFIKTETDPTGGTNYNIIGTSQLLSVPYALYAEKSGSLVNNNTSSNSISQISHQNNVAVTWVQCADYCSSLTEGGFTDWRMASIEEATTYRSLISLPAGDTWWGTWTTTIPILPIIGTTCPGTYIQFDEVNGTWCHLKSSSAGAGCRCVR